MLYPPPKWLFKIEVKKNYQEDCLVYTKKFIYLFGFKIKSKRLKPPHIFGDNNHIFLNGREVQTIKGFEIYIEGNNNRVEFSINDKSNLSGNHIYISGNDNSLRLVEPCYINKTSFFIRNNNNEVIIDKNTTFRKSLLVLCNQAQLLIGKNFSAGQELNVRVHGPKRKISIGDNCMFSWNIYVWATDVHFIYDKTTKKRLNSEQDVVIGNHVWVGRHASVHKGAKVPDGCIVGANSFVTKVFREKNVILAGTPAKIVRRNIYWEG